MSGSLNPSPNQSAAGVIELCAVPEPHKTRIQKIAHRMYNDKTQATESSANMRAGEIDAIICDINTEIERVDAALKGTAWTEAYNVLVTMKNIAQNSSAAGSMRRASQYDTPWPGTRWR